MSPLTSTVGVSGDVTLVTCVADEATSSYMYDEGSSATQCGANQNNVLLDAFPLDETRRPMVLMETGIYVSRRSAWPSRNIE